MKTAIVFWSGTGNTEAMAQSVADGAKAAGAEVAVFTCDSFNEAMIDDYDSIAFGCPSMGAEQLEEDEFEPMFGACIPKLSSKKIALFGSYGWGDGEWMRSWKEECENAGAVLVSEPVICNEAPDDEAIAACEALGKSLTE
ncbi:flavodoxin [Ruminococcus difficilis]|uniref:Flavodoxin n=1 Tax=Ruminococcus difficilis TaxID=2763069 RepID=A0A934TYF2_9FIRM|nr:flavodoxin [Ruminococcus difficilis]MBK6087510.1 flavodoxin [Ruminococcus difficilis]